PQFKQRKAARRLASANAFLAEISGLDVGADEDRRIRRSQHHAIPRHVSAAALRSGDVTSRSSEKSSTPGRSESPSGRMITYRSLSSVIAWGPGSMSNTISV